MIKVKLLNPDKGRNGHTFRVLLMIRELLPEYSIELTESDDFDFLIVGMMDFLNKNIPLQDSIDFGLEQLSKISGDYFLMDGSDSTSIMAAYEVFEQSDAIYLIRNQYLSQEDYRQPALHGKWFFGDGSDMDLSYDIPDDVYARMKLSGYNLGFYWPMFFQYDFQPNSKKSVDVCAIYGGYHKENDDHGVRNDIAYTNHRVGAWNILEGMADRYKIIKDKLPYEQFHNAMLDSKITLSPFGMGEVCFRDFEIIQHRSIMLKPWMDRVITKPNIYEPYKTYIPCEYDWSDLEEKIDDVLSNFDHYNQMTEYTRQEFLKRYDFRSVAEHWYNLFAEMDSVERG